MSKKQKTKKLTKADSDTLALYHANKVKECIDNLKAYDSPALRHLNKLMDEFIASKRKHKGGKS